VVLLYLLKLKRKRQVVPSVLLWRRSLQDLTANSPFQKLRTNPLLLLQLLLFLLLTLSLMRPVLHLESMTGLNHYVLLDRSASMAATDVKPTRLDAAKDKVRAQIRSLGAADRMMIVAFAEHSEVASPLSGDKGELLTALDRIQVEETGTDLHEALAILKAAIGEETPRSRIMLYSDGCIPKAAELMPPAVETTFIQVAGSGFNLGISRFAITSSPGETSRIDVFVEVAVNASGPGKSTLSLAWNGETIDAQPIEWEGDTTLSRIFHVPEPEAGLVTATIDAADDLPSDNRAGAFLATPEPIRVELVTHGNRPLEKVLSLVPDTIVEAVAPEIFPGTGQVDVAVFDAWPPPAIPKEIPGSLLLGADLPAEYGMSATQEVSFPVVLDWDRTHPVTRGAEYRNLQVAKAKRPKLPPEASVLLEGRDAPLLFCLEEGERRLLVSTFALFDSNWTRLYSFPITLANAVRWLSGRGNSLSVAEIHKTGTAIEILPQQGQSSVSIHDPAGHDSVLALEPSQRAFYSATTHVGAYALAFASGTGKSEYYNLLNSAESSISPKENLQLGKEEIHAAAAPRPKNQEVWRATALVALLVLAGEWWLYTRQSWT
jgi:hypothetical protein